ncbi:AsmA family protein [Terasakiella sp.]|uniref:AsmA family protein n=1 Tax=Terasakiella sp. TaxID=2034861 RepID=UPI003AFF98A4
MKKVLIALFIFVTILAAAILVIPSFIDWSGHRAEIAKKVKEATGRELIIGGNIAFTVIPSPVLKIGDIHLANAANASSTDMIAVEQLDVRVSLLPLLAGNIHVQSIRLIRPIIQLEILENGKGNWLFTTSNTAPADIETTKQSNDPAFIENDTANKPSLPIQIDNLIIEQGQLVYLDQANQIREEIRDINSRFGIAGLNGPFEAAGTMLVRNIPIGIEGSIGQIIHGRTASFATQIRFAHGKTSTRITGTLVNLAEGPKVSAKINLNGDSLAGFISAFQKTNQMAGGLDRTFSARGEMTYSPNGLSLGKDGLTLMMGDDRGTLHVEYEKKETQQLRIKANFSKIDGDAWLDASPYKVVEPAPLAPVITLSTKQPQQGSRISAAIDTATPPKEQAVKTPSSPNIPNDLNATVAINVDALLFKEQAIRQAQANISLTQGEIALERLSAILPGAGELTVLGVAGDRNGKLNFDGTLDLNVTHLRGALNWLQVNTSNVPLERLQQVTLKSDLNVTGEELHLLNLEAKLDGSTLNGGLSIALQSRPSFGASFHLDQLNLDAYLGQEIQSPAPAQNDSTTAQNPSVPENPAAQSPTSLLESLALLNTFDANLDLSAGQVVYRNQTIEDIYLNATIFDGKLDIQDTHITNLAGIRLTGKGSIAPTEDGYRADNLFLSLDAPHFTEGAALMGLGNVLDWSKIGAGNASITFNGPVLSPDMDINITALDTTFFAAAKADLLPLPTAEASINIAIADVAKLTKGLGVNYRPRSPLTKIDISADLNADLTQTTLKNIIAQIGNDQVSGHILFKQQSHPHLDVNLQADRLDVTPFLPADDQTTSSNINKVPTTNTSQASAASNRWSQEAIDFAFMQNMDADFQLNAKQLLYKKVILDNLALKAQLQNAELNINDASANLFGGQAKISSKIVAGETNNIQATITAKDMKLKPLLNQIGSTTAANGILALNTTLATQGKSENDFISHLNGNGSLNLNQVSVSGKNTGGSLLIFSISWRPYPAKTHQKV